MLQQNNNNNYLCLDMAHRELLQGYGKSNAPLGFGAIGFGAIPLIKGLRAWAVNGGFNSRSRRKPVGENNSQQQPDSQRGWKTKENLASVRTPGALVTVATLKGSEGARQTQTQCLFLKADGCSYLCTVGSNRVAGPRTAGQWVHPNSAEGTGGEAYCSGRGRRASQDEAGVCNSKPQAVRKWRKSCSVVKSMEKSSATENKEDAASSKFERRQKPKRDSKTEAQKEGVSATSDCSTTQCLKAKYKQAAFSSPSRSIDKNTTCNEMINVDESHLDRCELEISTKAGSSVPGNSEACVEEEVDRLRSDSMEEGTASIKHECNLVANANINHNAKLKGKHFTAAVPTYQEFTPESKVLMQVSHNRNGATETIIEDIIGASLKPPDNAFLSSTEMNQESMVKTEIKNRDLMASDNDGNGVVIQSEEQENNETLHKSCTKTPKVDPVHLGVGSRPKVIQSENGHSEEILKDTLEDHGQGHDHTDMKSGSKTRLDKEFIESETDQYQVDQNSHQTGEDDKPLNLENIKSIEKSYGHGHDTAEMESRSKTRPVKDSLKSEADISEVVIHSEMSTNTENNKDLDMASTKIFLEDCGQDQDFIRFEKDQSDLVHSLQMKKERFEALDVASTMSSLEDSGQSYGPTGVDSTSKARNDKNSFEDENGQSVEKEEDKSLHISKAKSPERVGRHGQDLASLEKGSRYRIDQDSLKNESEVVIYSKVEKKDEDQTLDMESANSSLDDPGQGQDLQTRNDPPEKVIDFKDIDKDDDLDLASRKGQVEDGRHDKYLACVENRCRSKIDKDSIKKETEKDEDQTLDIESTSNPLDDPGQVQDLKRKNDPPEEVIHFEDMEKDEDDLASPKGPTEDVRHYQDLAGVEIGSKDRRDINLDLDIASTKIPNEYPSRAPLEECDFSQHMKEVNSGCEKEWFSKSSSRGSPKASVVVATACLPNPSTSNPTTAIATALSRQEEVGAGFRSLRPWAESQYVSEQENTQEWSKVATNDRPVDVGEEEEDEFGVFMQAGEEQMWTEAFNKLQHVPSGTYDDIDHSHSTDANEPMSWTSDWTGVQSFHQSEDTWAAFKQKDDNRGAGSEIAPAGQWWSMFSAENKSFTLSSLHSGSSVFLEAFPLVDSSCGDTECVPTLKELLQKPAENNSVPKPQNLLDSLQDLERMIDVKYKRAESLSRKLLLQSLHLGAVTCERGSSRKQTTSRFSPNLPSSNQQLVANAKRRLSYDINRNIMA